MFPARWFATLVGSSYTLAHTVWTQPSPNDVNVIERFDADFDLRHRFVFTANYELPFGRNLTGMSRHFFSGWQMNAVASWQSGLPFNVTNSTADANTSGANDRPNLVGDPEISRARAAVGRAAPGHRSERQTCTRELWWSGRHGGRARVHRRHVSSAHSRCTAGLRRRLRRVRPSQSAGESRKREKPMMRFIVGIWAAILMLCASALSAQQPPPGQGAAGVRPEGTVAEAFDPAVVERGKDLHVARCGFCHGTNARGGSGGPDLTRSPIVQEDEGGKGLGAFLKVGRPDRGMPPFQLTDAETSDLATFLHSAINLAANRRLYQVLDIIVGDPKAGEAYFNGAGKCSSCHSASGDLKGVGAKYDPAILQGRMVMPRQGRPPGGGSGVPPTPPYLDRNAITAMVTLPSGATVTGNLVRLTDFDVTVYDLAAGEMRSWLRKDDLPKVIVTDPLQAHIDLWTRWTDADMHNMTAYLAGLK